MTFIIADLPEPLAPMMATNSPFLISSVTSFDYLFPLVPIISIFSCLLILAGILAGVAVLRGWRKKLNELEAKDATLPSLGNNHRIDLLGWSAPVLLPLIFLVAWIYVLVRGLAG